MAKQKQKVSPISLGNFVFDVEQLEGLIHESIHLGEDYIRNLHYPDEQNVINYLDNIVRKIPMNNEKQLSTVEIKEILKTVINLANEVLPESHGVQNYNQIL